jgi:hypothetical protein
MTRSREETALQDLPRELLHALFELQHTHPAVVGRVGPLARPGALLFTAATDIVLTARVQMSGAETMHELNETLRAITGGMHAHFTGPGGVALEVTLSRRQESPNYPTQVLLLTDTKAAAGITATQAEEG